jgi:hypothetical protein
MHEGIRSNEATFNREAFSTNLRNYIHHYVGRINGIDTNSLIDDATEAELIRVIDSLSEGDAIPGKDVDGVNVAQDFALEISRKFTLITGPTRDGVSDDPEVLREQIHAMAAEFTMNPEDIPPTVSIETLPLVDVEGKNTRLSNRIVASISQKLFAHPYFQGLEDRYYGDIVRALDVNITKPLILITGEDPSPEELDAYMELFLSAVVADIDKDVRQRNAMIEESKQANESGKDNEEESGKEAATPADIIRGLVAADHDYLMSVASSLKHKLERGAKNESSAEEM